jgi:predicted secreted acid phosphatase
MLKRLVAPVLALGLALLLPGCLTPSSRAPDRTALAPTALTPAAEPANLSALKQELKLYLDSGRYDAAVSAVAAEAAAWIEQRTARGGEKLAVILDIDETTLSNLSHMREMDFGYVPALWDEWVAAADGPAIESMRQVFQLARARGVTVFFLTGRKTTDSPGTMKNLVATGYGDHAGVYFKPNDYPGTTQAFKTATRQRLTEEGYTIIANIGDQQSDLDGGFAERTFKLPNPFYLTK